MAGRPPRGLRKQVASLLPAQFHGQVAVFQPRPGLGDLIWHLPLIRAIAAASPSRRVTLVAKPSTQAAALLDGDPAIERVVWFDHNPRDGQGRHDGPLGLVRLAATLRRCRLDSCVLLHHSFDLAAAMAVAGIADRYGYGYGAQRRWLTRPPFLDRPAPFTEAAEQAAAYARALHLWPLQEPSVTLQPPLAQAAGSRLAGMPGKLAILGAGCHGAERQWGADRFGCLAAELRRLGWTVLVAVSATEAALADDVRRASGGAVDCAVGWCLADIAAGLAEAGLFVGNDSGLMNLRAALGRPAYGLFGASGPLRHSANIRAIVPPGGARAGMKALQVEHVMDALLEDAALTIDITTEPKPDRSSVECLL